MANELMQAALAYEAKGFSVIPLKPKDKIPLIPSWTPYQISRADREQIGQWWRTWPDANIGIVTGDISGICVIDCDSPEAATALKPTLGDMADVAVAATGKGFHLYYAHTGKLSNKAGVKQQVDFRGDGGYVVAAPSVHANGKVYQWIKPLNGHLRELPPEFVKAMTAPPVDIGAPKPKFDTAGALAGLPVGRRDEGIFKLACKLRGADVPYETAIDLCEQAAANCVPPFDNARRKVDQAYKYTPGRSQQAQEPQQGDFWPEPLTARQLIDLPPDQTRWVWLECLPLRATSALIAKPYVGKSTFCASLALAVARGHDFLGRPTQQGAVLYCYLDGPQDELKENLVHAGMRGEDPVFAYAGRKPDRVVEWVGHISQKLDVRLVIVDTAQKFFGFKEDRYEEKINAMQPMLDLCQERNFHAMFTYHAAKAAANTVSALGSTASEANARVSLYLRKKDESDKASVRLFDSDQNTGKRFETLCLSDPADGFLTSQGSVYTVALKELAAMVRNEIADTPGITEGSLRELLKCDRTMLNRALNRMMEQHMVERTGLGRAGNPFHYHLAKDLTKQVLFDP